MVCSMLEIQNCRAKILARLDECPFCLKVPVVLMGWRGERIRLRCPSCQLERLKSLAYDEDLVVMKETARSYALNI